MDRPRVAATAGPLPCDIDEQDRDQHDQQPDQRLDQMLADRGAHQLSGLQAS